MIMILLGESWKHSAKSTLNEASKFKMLHQSHNYIWYILAYAESCWEAQLIARLKIKVFFTKNAQINGIALCYSLLQWRKSAKLVKESGNVVQEKINIANHISRKLENKPHPAEAYHRPVRVKIEKINP